MNVTIDQLAACTGANLAAASAWLAPIQTAADKYQINTPKRLAAFLAEIGVESAKLSRVRENLNYSPAGLLATFNNPRITRFTNVDAYRYGRTIAHPADQETIANIAYAGRMGNGPMESGDGWAYRGGGPGQLTGKDNYARCGAALGIDLITNPELIEIPATGAMAFGWFWDSGNRTGKSLNEFADVDDISGLSQAVNGGSNGLSERLALYQIALETFS